MKKLLVIGVLISLGFAGSHNVAPANNPLYQKECASCHFGFQPEFLPKASWVKIMSNLGEHFGTDASLEEGDRAAIEKYLVDNSASSFFSLRDEVVNTQITKLPYFVKEHREVPTKFIKQKEVGSLVNCNACHTKAIKGDYSERNIFIPNYGRWDD